MSSSALPYSGFSTVRFRVRGYAAYADPSEQVLMRCDCHERNSDRSPNVLVGPGVEKRVQLAAIDCRSVACVLEGSKHEVTREGPTGPRVSTKSGVSGVFPEWFREVRSSGELRSY